jgi:hypothetical protein
MEHEQDEQAPANITHRTLLRDKWVGVRFTLTEYETLKRKAQKAGLTLSELLRRAANNVVILERLSNEDLGHVRQLSGMATNLNQIAHKINAEGFALTAEPVFQQYTEMQQLLTKLKR